MPLTGGILLVAIGVTIGGSNGSVDITKIPKCFWIRLYQPLGKVMQIVRLIFMIVDVALLLNSKQHKFLVLEKQYKTTTTKTRQI